MGTLKSKRYNAPALVKGLISWNESASIVGNVESGLIAALCVAAISTGLRKRVGEDKLLKALLKTTRKIDRHVGL